MTRLNTILTSLNQPLSTFTFLVDANGAPVSQQTFDGVPLGTLTNASDGELAVKTIQIGARNIPGLSIPTHDSLVIAYYASTNNIQTVTYKLLGDTVAVLTLTYAGSGVADDDLLTGVTK